MSRTFDVVVVGSGPGGYVVAVRAAQLGRTVAVVERGAIGGRCLNVACIPAKAVLRAADVATEARGAAEFGVLVGEVRVDFAAVQARRASVVGTLTKGVSGLLRKHRVAVVPGDGVLVDGHTVRVGDETLTATTGIVLATGSVARPLPGIPFGGRVIGTEEAWVLDALPDRLAVVGAGASGAEIASAYARLGTHVTLLEAADRVLPTEDADVSKVVDAGLRKQGIEVVVGAAVTDVVSGTDAVSYAAGGVDRTADRLVNAAGRGPDVAALGLDAAGVALDDRGRIAVDGALRTSVPGVWAIGDLVTGPALAHKASEEGIVAVEDACGLPTAPLRHADIPRATFCSPNVASFGLTEDAARAAGHDIVIGKVPYGAAGATTVHGARQGLVKIVGDREHGEILGAHVVGAKATDLLQELVNAKAFDAGYQDVARVVHGHPTFSEAILEAARAADGWVVHG